MGGELAPPDIERFYEDDWRGRGLCVGRERDPKLPDTPARFREFHLARELYSVVRRAGVSIVRWPTGIGAERRESTGATLMWKLPLLARRWRVRPCPAS